MLLQVYLHITYFIFFANVLIVVRENYIIAWGEDINKTQPQELWDKDKWKQPNSLKIKNPKCNTTKGNRSQGEVPTWIPSIEARSYFEQQKGTLYWTTKQTTKDGLKIAL